MLDKLTKPMTLFELVRLTGKKKGDVLKELHQLIDAKKVKQFATEDGLKYKKEK